MPENEPKTGQETKSEAPVAGNVPEVAKVSAPAESAAPAQKEQEKPAEWPKKFKNWTHGPLTLDLPTHGTVAMGGKSSIWLWPDDYAEPSVQRAVQAKLLILWNDRSEQPKKRPERKPETKRPERGKLDVPQGQIRIRGTLRAARQTLAQALVQEGPASAPEPAQTKNFSREGMVPSGDAKPTAARQPRRG